MLKLSVHALLATKLCPFWILSTFQVALTLLALLLKLKAEVTDQSGAIMHTTLLAAFVVTHSVHGIAGPRAAIALNPAVPLVAASVLANAALVLTATVVLSA